MDASTQQNMMRQLTEMIAERLYRHSRHKAVEWAKEDKFDSYTLQAKDILALIGPIVAEKCVAVIREDLAEPEPFRYEGAELEQAIRNLFDPEL